MHLILLSAVIPIITRTDNWCRKTKFHLHLQYFDSEQIFIFFFFVFINIKNSPGFERARVSDYIIRRSIKNLKTKNRNIYVGICLGTFVCEHPFNLCCKTKRCTVVPRVPAVTREGLISPDTALYAYTYKHTHIRV